jgi:AbrB family looped-hinge helix DNA binding protein
MKRIALKVDSKGRIQIPKKLRDELGIRDRVSVSIDDGSMTIEPVERIFDKLAAEVKFNFQSVVEELPRLRRTAEEELFKQVS